MSRPNYFIGLPVPAEGWFEALPRPGPGVRAFAASDLHATVAFLGRVDEPRARAAFDWAGRWPTGPLGIRLGQVRPMGHPRRASALSAMVHPAAPPCEGEDPEPPLERAMRALRGPMLEAAGARPDDRPPLPHVTLARITRRATREERRAALSWAAQLDLGSPSLLLDRIALYTWSSDRRSALFRIVAELRFAPESGPGPG